MKPQELSLSPLLMHSPTSSLAATSSPQVVVGRREKIDILFVIGYSSHIVLACRLLLPSIGSFFVDNAL